MKAGLPQDGVVEQTLDENHLRTMPDLLPAIQAPLGAWQKSVRRRRSREAAAIEVAFQGKDEEFRKLLDEKFGKDPEAGATPGMAESMKKTKAVQVITIVEGILSFADDNTTIYISPIHGKHGH